MGKQEKLNHIKSFEPFRPDGLYDAPERRLLQEEYFKGRRRHRDDGPAVIVYSYGPFGAVRRWETWYCENKIHRDGGPAKMVFDSKRTGPFGDITITEPLREEYFANGKRHREGGPAIIERDETYGTVIQEDWYLNGQRGRLQPGPNQVHYDAETGFLYALNWLKGEKPHREDGPAYLERDPVNGSHIEEYWYLNGKPFRVGGPADVIRNVEKGTTKYAYWAKGRRRYEAEIRGLHY